MSKRYERMSKEDIISAYNSVPNGGCSECHARNWCNEITKKHTCVETITEWLNKEIKMKKVHRYELIKSPEDLEKFRSECAYMCEHTFDCTECKCYSAAKKAMGCFCAFLNEEIEVEENE